MAKIILISCVKTKLNKKAKAEDLYISNFFKKSLAYAKSLNPDKIFILSAKYGLLKLNDEIEPYEKTLNKMKQKDRKEWANNVIKNLTKETDLKNDEFVILAGKKYREFLIPEINNYTTPLARKPFLKQIQWLKEKTNESQL
jgi:cytoplasmic iron level regulating protein YaaA (DUF328/UPF0246 family)